MNGICLVVVGFRRIRYDEVVRGAQAPTPLIVGIFV